MLTVQRALSVAPLTQAKVVAGQTGLNRQINHITIMEVPDLVQWLKGNDFIITSLYCIKDDPDAQVKLIQDIARLGCAALAIKTNRYVKTLPTEMIAAANELSFPLIEIPKHVTYIDIINPLMEQLLNHTAGVLRQADMAFRWLQEVILSDQGLEAALSTLQRLVGCDLTLECPELNLKLSAPEGKKPLDPLPADAARYLHNTCHPVFLQRSRDEQDVPSLVIPIMCRSSAYAFLTVEDYQQNQGLAPTSQAILDHGTALIATEIMKLHSRAELERQHVNSFMEELIAQDFKSDKAMLERARYLGLNLNNPCLPIVFDVDEFWQSIEKKRLTENDVQVLKSRLQRDLISYLKTHSEAAFIVAQRSDSLVILTMWPLEQSVDDITAAAHKLAKNILLHLRRAFPSLRFTGGIGQPYAGVRNIGRSFNQARKAIVLGRHAYSKGQVFSYSELGVYRLLCSHPDPDELIALRDEVLGPLAAYDDKQNTDFIATLHAYFFHNEDINNTAKALFVHPNTIRYRLERAAALLGLDLGSADHRFQIYLALKIASLYPFGADGQTTSNSQLND
ncbi:MAG: PucR family transcriptional regulator [bacterium]|jgi:purine catabolism regulator